MRRHAFALLAPLALGCIEGPPRQAYPDCVDGTCDRAPYIPVGDCDGFPRIDVETPPGMCMGLVTTGLSKPRGIAQLPGGDFIVTDMGGWGTNLGSVWRLHIDAQHRVTKTKILKEIDRPSGVATGPDGLPYVGASDAIFRFDPDDGRSPPRLSLVARDLPTDGRHPLTHFVFDPGDPHSLYVNIGSFSDVCEQEGSGEFPFPCPEEQGAAMRGGIRRYDLGDDLRATGFETIARGLRNSMGLAVHAPSGTLLQAENSRDSIDKLAPELAELEGELPHEELNVIADGGHYGWPYCYDNGVPSPEYPDVDCSVYQAPALLLPGHAAPLGMVFYDGTLFPSAYRGNLIVGYHGYRSTGHRIVVIPIDESGIPNGKPLDLVRNWDTKATTPQGAPVGLVVASDGSIYIADDKNHAILRLTYDPGGGDGEPMEPLEDVQPAPTPDDDARCADLAQRSDAFSKVQRDVIDLECVGCHGAGPGYPGGLALLRCDAVGNAARLLAPRDGEPPLVMPGDLDSELHLRLLGDGFPQMPAGGVSPEQLELVEAWIEAGAPAPQ